MYPRLADSDMVTVSSGPGIRAPERATVKDVVKITMNSIIYNLGPDAVNLNFACITLFLLYFCQDHSISSTLRGVPLRGDSQEENGAG